MNILEAVADKSPVSLGLETAPKCARTGTPKVKRGYAGDAVSCSHRGLKTKIRAVLQGYKKQSGRFPSSLRTVVDQALFVHDPVDPTVPTLYLTGVVGLTRLAAADVSLCRCSCTRSIALRRKALAAFASRRTVSRKSTI